MSALIDGLRIRFRQRPDSEHLQHAVRIVIAVLLFAYVWTMEHQVGRSGYLAKTWWVLTWEVVVSLGLLTAIAARPGISHVRRCIGMLSDYTCIVVLMLATADAGGIFYVICLWVTIGNGLRYGGRYLLAATAVGTLSLVLVSLFSAYWRSTPTLAGGLLLGQIAIPLYFRSLLAALTRALNDARQANDAKSKFLANMSHEFRTPLNGLSGTAELLAVTKLDAEQSDYLRAIQASTRSLRSLVEEVLDISAIEAGKVRLIRTDFSVVSLLDSVALILRPQATNKGIGYRVEIDPDIPANLVGDAGHLSQVLLNLIGNAVKFTDEGYVDLKVSKVATLPNDRICIRFEVRDTGIGVPASIQSQVFDAFQQGEMGLSRSYEGTGLGTAIAKGLVESMGGAIGYHENQPCGSVFWFEIPIGVGAEAPIAEKEAPLDALSEQISNVIAFSNPFLRHRARVRPMRILVVDDHEANRMVVQRMLEKAGHSAVCLSGTADVLDLLVQESCDAVISDLHMPGLSGLDLLRQMRVMHASGMPYVPVVILSADVTVESIRRCEEAGVHAFLGKPVEAGKLLGVLAEIASGARLPDARARVQEPQVDDELVFDSRVLDELAELGMGNEFEAQFIEQCLADATRCLQSLQQAGQSGKTEEYRALAHALRGVSANLGLSRLAVLASKSMLLAIPLPPEWLSLFAQMQGALAQGRDALETRRRQSRRDSDQQYPPS
ncbi:ATP-binding protein [Xanthomonas sp. 3058]|uniref:ATP-binding protein n=1 Tax=Xanthomonas sp. 3058 TaxID=3035314 RepID=UPI00161455A0|nr:ATP-binding protein [Xanthomonas sp. 3058]MBB5865846.1 two-component system sensor histidine kinase RpfC [Xanthomonas sp. 3058]